jgi:GPH family glycoside/pentoside/hexuronide:cation symporter
MGMAFFAATMMVLIFIQPGTPMAIVYTITALAGIGVAAAHVIPQAILPDAIEWDELRTGQRHEGVFYSLVMLAQKVASSIAVPLAGLALEVSHYDPDAAVQPMSALLAIRALTGVVPTILVSIGILFAWRYPLSREGHADIRRQLAEQRTQVAEVK